MKKLMAIAVLAAGLFGAAGATQAQDRLIDGALGAGAGALVGGPVGAVAGGVIGYSAGPQIDRTLRGGGRKYRRHHHHRRHHQHHRRHHHR